MIGRPSLRLWVGSLGLAAALAFAAAVHARQETKPSAPAASSLDLGEIQKKIYDPTREGLNDLSLAFDHPAFSTNSAFSKMSLRLVWKKEGDRSKVLVNDVVPAYEEMAKTDQFTRIFDYVWRFAGPQAILREKVERADATPDGVAVKLAATDMRKSWVLRFTERGGRLLLSSATSPEYGSITVDYSDVGGLHLASRLTIDDPKRPIGKFTMDFRDMKANSGVADSLFK